MVKEKEQKKEYTDIVSVIVPTYNSEEYIRECIESILNNTYRNLEVICIDDGSTDNTLDILNIIKKRDERLIILEQDHKGVSAARNKGLDKATGKYISFVDSDDFINWNMYEILVEVAEENNLDLIFFGGNAIGEAPDWVWERLNTSFRHYRKGEAKGVVFKEIAATPFLWLHFIKRSLFEKKGKIRFDESMHIGEDSFVQFQYVPKAESLMVIVDKLYNYRINNNASVMQFYYNRRYEKFYSHVTLVSNVMTDWKNKKMFDSNKDSLFIWAINLFLYHIISFPLPFQPELAKKALKLFNEIDPEFSLYYLNEQERNNYKYLIIMSEKEMDITEDIDLLIEKIKKEKNEIRETLCSRAFKIGRSLTKKSDRIDMRHYEKYLKDMV